MKKPKVKISTEIIFPANTPPCVVNEGGRSGWGPEYQSVTFAAQPVEFTVRVGERAGIGIRVKEDGSLIVTNYGGQFETIVEQNMHLSNSRSWKEVKE